MTDPRFCAYCRQRGHLPFGVPCSVCHDTSGFQPEVGQVEITRKWVAVLVAVVLVTVALAY